MFLNLPQKIGISTGCFAILSLIIGWLLPEDENIAWFAGYFLGLLAVIIHLFTSIFAQNSSEKKFIGIYYISLFVRFLIVCVIFILIISLTKIDEFSFTVSFIISYIYHSVNEVIYLNHKVI